MKDVVSGQLVDHVNEDEEDEHVEEDKYPHEDLPSSRNYFVYFDVLDLGLYYVCIFSF